ncbi:MAG: ABC transporter substrate-binding protein [Gemmatimonadota bacterium]
MSDRQRATRGISVGIVTTTLWLAACGGTDRPSSNGGGTVVVGIRSDLAGINPVTYTDQYTGEIINYALFTPLIQYDENLKVKPHLAESWELTADTGVVFKLRNDVKWHDGQPVTVDDVKFTFDLAKDPAAASGIGSVFLPEVDRAEIVDSTHIRFHFARPHAQALEDFWWAPVPKHLLQNVAAAELKNAPYNRQPVGSGPFKFSEWQANQRIVLVPNPDYPAALGGPAAADRLVLRIIPEAPTMLTELKTGGVHVDIPLLPDQLPQIKNDQTQRLFSFQGRTVYYIGWNNQRAPFTSAAVRRALSMAVNRQEIIDVLLSGEGAVATSTVPPKHPLYPGDVQPIPFDQQQAMQLLEQDGWRDANGDGLREKGGKPLRFTLLSTDNSLNRAVAEMVQAQLRKVGAEVQLRAMEFQTLRTQHVNRDFDAVFTSWVLDNFQMAAAPMALLHSKNAAVKGSANRSSVALPELDRAIDQASVATDEAQARAAWKQITEILNREQPLTFMYWLNELAVASQTVQGVTMDARGEFMSVPQWRIGR